MRLPEKPPSDAEPFPLDLTINNRADRWGDQMEILQEALTFDDVLLLPCHSTVLPSEAEPTTTLSSKISLRIPILSAAMDTVTEAEMSIAMASAGGLGIIHKSNTPERQADLVREVKAKGFQVGAAIGIGDDGHSRAQMLIAAGVDLIAVDTAHGHSQLVIECVDRLKQQNPNLSVMAGNIVTAEAARALAQAGADCVKVGVGPGSICITRIVAGVGMPQLTAIQQVAASLQGTNTRVIADGGIRYSGDVVKALAAGAHAVMIGGLLAGTNEAPGDIQMFEGRAYKAYRGMGSSAAAQAGSADRYFQHKQKGKFTEEGAEGFRPHTGSAEDVLDQLIGGLRLGMGYLGARTLTELQQNAQFVRVTGAGRFESHVHSLAYAKDTANYKRVV